MPTNEFRKLEKSTYPDPWLQPTPSVNDRLSDYERREMGMLVSSGAAISDRALAMHVRDKAVAGDRESAFVLGVYFANGMRSVRQSSRKAVHWFEVAANAKDKDAIRCLARAYHTGDGVEADDSKAADLLKTGGLLGDACCQYDYGTCLHHGIGLDRDVTKAAAWYRMAAKQGHAGAMCELGVMYLLGEGVNQNFDEAYALIAPLAEKSIPQGMYYLGIMYLRGLGVRHDEARGSFLVQKAKDSGFNQNSARSDSTITWGWGDVTMIQFNTSID